MPIEELTRLRGGIYPVKLDLLRAAIRGQSVPESFPLDLVIKCVVAGIRYHDGFAQELRSRSLNSSTERALNARDIMSNRILDMKQPDEIPYCFWHPGLLPDVAISEEARDNLPGSKDIYDMVMKAPILYRAMDDYKLCLLENPEPLVFLNSDTCVQSTLDQRQPVSHELFPPPFDITEDWCLGAEGIRSEARVMPHDTISLLHTSLPRHLPTVDKDILILMAAFTGNVDRYMRLWCYQQPELAVLRSYIHARSIMNNDLAWLNENQPIPESDLPRITWYPEIVDESTYEELAYLVPEMKQLEAQALIVCDAYNDFATLEPKATFDLWEEMHNRAYPGKFKDFFDEHMTEAQEWEWAEWSEFPPDIHDIAPYDHLVSKEMKPG
ncbi:hypothetical protein ACHAP7_002189 [Fusarium lateritium]